MKEDCLRGGGLGARWQKERGRRENGCEKTLENDHTPERGDGGRKGGCIWTPSIPWDRRSKQISGPIGVGATGWDKRFNYTGGGADNEPGEPPGRPFHQYGTEDRVSGQKKNNGGKQRRKKGGATRPARYRRQGGLRQNRCKGDEPGALFDAAKRPSPDTISKRLPDTGVGAGSPQKKIRRGCSSKTIKKLGERIRRRSASPHAFRKRGHSRRTPRHRKGECGANRI